MRFVQALSFAVFISFLASTAYALNPQPEPPGVALNPQPEPPGVTDAAKGKDPSLTASSDSHGEADGLKLKRNPSLTHGSDSSEKKHHLRKPSLTHGSDSSEKKLHPKGPTLTHGSDSGDAKHKQPPAPPVRDTGSPADDMMADPTVGVGAEGGR